MREDVKVKICGITNAEDAHAAIDAGADVLGFIVDVPVDTPRKISVDEAYNIIKILPPFVPTTIVLMPRSVGEVVDAVEILRPNSIQLHGSESFRFVKKVKEEIKPTKIIKTISIDKKTGKTKFKETVDPTEAAKLFSEVADAILLDTYLDGIVGGTGAVHDWSVDKKISNQIDIPLILAGGLNPENVSKAVKIIKPYAVDVAGGVEKEGRKNYKKMRRFIKAAKKAVI